MNNYFKENIQYKKLLDSTAYNFYFKYVNDIIKLINSDGKFLDVGCGTGRVLKLLSNKISKSNIFGVDISDLFINELKNEFNVCVYDGNILPFEDDFFNVVGSFTVLEHIDKPYKFLDELIRITKKGGYIIISCPNFLSFFNNVRGYSFSQKIYKLLKYILGGKLEKNPPIIRENFQSDDDAIVVTSIPPIVNYLKKKNLKIIEISGIMTERSALENFISKLPLIRLFLPSCYIIAKKK